MINLRMLCLSRLRDKLYQQKIAIYQQRIQKIGRGLSFGPLTMTELNLKNHLNDTHKTEQIKDAVGGDYCLAFDSTGRDISSRGFADILDKARTDQIRQKLTFVIGNCDGLPHSFLSSCDHILAIGQMTWPNELVRLMVVEQFYRALTILAGMPYHCGH